MRSIRAADSLADGFEPGPMPPPRPDGSLDLPLMRAADEPPPRMCEVGPCRHYHTFTIVMDAQKALAGELAEGGQLVGDAGAEDFHVEIQHHCYPTVGIETDLGSTPIVSCNRWNPSAVFKGRLRRQYETALDRWLEGQRQNTAAALAADEDAASALADAAAARGDSPTSTPEGTPAA